jgi:hypothetical protein
MILHRSTMANNYSERFVSECGLAKSAIYHISFDYANYLSLENARKFATSTYIHTFYLLDP